MDVGLRRVLDFRSLLIVPVRLKEDVIGIAEVFSPLPGNFDGGDILLLSSITELIAELYSRNLEGIPPKLLLPCPSQPTGNISLQCLSGMPAKPKEVRDFGL